MNRGKMTATRLSPVFSVSLVTLLIWGCTTVICESFINDKSTMQPVTTTTGYNLTGKMTSDAVGTSTDSYACGDTSLKCPHICAICKEYFGASTMDCLSFILDNFCLPKFNNTMMLQNSTDWCTWGNVNSLYSNLSFCTEEVSDCLLIPWPNRLVEEIFVDIHSKFFLECPTEEFTDPPPAIIFALVITPICLIPLMVSLVVLKTKNGDGTS